MLGLYPVSFLGDHGVGEGMLSILSRGGCVIASDVSVQLGTVLTVLVHHWAPDQPIVVDRAEVAWVAGRDFGVKFLRLRSPERDRLYRLLVESEHDDLAQADSRVESGRLAMP